MPRQRGSTSTTTQRRRRIGQTRPTKFIRQRLTAFSLMLFTTSVGYKGLRVRPRLHSRSTRQMSLRPRRRVLRQLSRVLLLQTNEAKHPAEKRLPWLPRRRSQMPGRKLPALRRPRLLLGPLRPRANQLRKLALSQNSRHLNRPQLVAKRRLLRRKPSQPRRRRLPLLHLTNRTNSRPLSKQVRRRNLPSGIRPPRY